MASGLRVVLWLTAPALAVLPWKMLFDPETETYLCRQEPLVRHVPAPYTPPGPGGQGSAEPLAIGAKAMEAAKSLETQRTPATHRAAGDS